MVMKMTRKNSKKETFNPQWIICTDCKFVDPRTIGAEIPHCMNKNVKVDDIVIIVLTNNCDYKMVGG